MKINYFTMNVQMAINLVKNLYKLQNESIDLVN